MQLVDCITAYAFLVDTLGVPPSDILMGGDSAGGHLALCLIRYLRDVVKVEELPRGLLLSSPLADMSYWLDPKSNPSANQDADFLNIAIVGRILA